MSDRAVDTYFIERYYGLHVLRAQISSLEKLLNDDVVDDVAQKMATFDSLVETYANIMDILCYSYDQ